MVNGILQALHQVEGVQATLVIDPGGELLAHRAHAVYDSSLLGEVSRTVVSAIDSVQLLHQDWEMLTATFADGRLLIRNLGATRAPVAGAVLAVVADARLNLSFAGVAIRVAAAKLKNLLDASGGLGAGTPPPPAGAALGRQDSSAALPALPRLPTPPGVPIAPLSNLGSGQTPSLERAGAAAADSASAAYLAACTKALAASVGPMAKVFVKEAVRTLCGDRPFSRDRAAALISELETHIDDPAERARFRRTVGGPG